MGKMDFTLLGMVVLWYGSSVVCTNTAKELKMQGWSSGSLTVAELAIATGCSFVMMILLKLRPYKPPSMQFNELKLTIMLATAFVFGFVTLNSAFGLMHVSLVMTVRATEPLFTMVAAKCFLGNEEAPWREQSPGQAGSSQVGPAHRASHRHAPLWVLPHVEAFAKSTGAGMRPCFTHCSCFIL